MTPRAQVPEARAGDRLHWRVTVQSASKQDGTRGGPKMAWHLVECADPGLDAAHCVEGRLLLAAGVDPDGHCLIDDACPRCAVLNARKAAIVTPQTNPPVAATAFRQATPPDSAKSRCMLRVSDGSQGCAVQECQICSTSSENRNHVNHRPRCARRSSSARDFHLEWTRRLSVWRCSAARTRLRPL